MGIRLFNTGQLVPPLRGDLELLEGPSDSNGAPTYTLFDPVRALYFHITWAQAQIFLAWVPNVSHEELVRKINARAPLNITESDVTDFIALAAQSNLLASHRSGEAIYTQSIREKGAFITKLLYGYLFFRVPLFSPDQFLQRTLPVARHFFSPSACLIYSFFVVMGFISLVARFPEFVSTFLYFFSFEGMVVYMLGVVAVKCVHELSHAYVAKYHGVSVRSMGIAFLVFWPVLFTDVTDSWRLTSRRKRLLISFAGVASELVIAGLATLGWAVSPPGILQSLFFVIASVTWISSLLVNLNPALKFDGYYMLCDLWGLDNAQTRSFAVARWKLRQWLLGLMLPCPEAQVRSGMVFYAVFTWLYRLVLYTAIALLVYLLFTKIIGIFLFIIEIQLLIILPIYREVQALISLRNSMTWNKRSISTVSVLAALFIWAALPWPHPIYLPGITVVAESQVVYVPYQGVVETIAVKKGSSVEKGDLLIRIRNELLDGRMRELGVEQQIVEREIEIIERSEEGKPLLPERIAKLKFVQAERNGLAELKEQLDVRATVSGMVYRWDLLAKVGQSVKRSQAIGRIADLSKVEVVAYVPEALLASAAEEKTVEFLTRGTRHRFRGRLVRLERQREALLEYPQLASTNGGSLPVTEGSNEKLFMVETYYPAHVALESETPIGLGVTGDVVIRGYWRSYMVEWLKYAIAVLWRESRI